LFFCEPDFNMYQNSKKWCKTNKKMSTIMLNVKKSKTRIWIFSPINSRVRQAEQHKNTFVKNWSKITVSPF